MTLQEALATGLKLKRPGMAGYVDSEVLRLTAVDATATDWTTEPSAIELTEAEFAAAWDRARGGSLNIKPSNNPSEFYLRLKGVLFTS
jgi:hypothetical protein